MQFFSFSNNAWRLGSDSGVSSFHNTYLQLDETYFVRTANELNEGMMVYNMVADAWVQSPQKFTNVVTRAAFFIVPLETFSCNIGGKEITMYK